MKSQTKIKRKCNERSVVRTTAPNKDNCRGASGSIDGGKDGQRSKVMVLGSDAATSLGKYFLRRGARRR